MSKVAKLSMYRPHKRVSLGDFGDSLARQEFAAECDINTIMKRYEKAGVISHVNRAVPRYGDFADLPDFQQSLNALNAATDSFMALPARVRREFDNDARAFVAYCQDEKNLEQLREWGLADVPPPPAAPMRVEVVNAPSVVPGASEAPSKA